MRALLVIAHGSRREAANAEFRQQVEQIAQQVSHAPVRAAFLELAEPGIVEGLRQLAADGAEAIDVFPLFLNAGRHVAQDIPEQVADAQQALPAVDIRLLDYLGRTAALPALVAQLVNEAGASRD